MTIKEASEEDARKAALTGGGDKSRQNISTRGIMLTDAEAEAIMDAYENEDVAEMTWTRRIVENYLQNVRLLTSTYNARNHPEANSHLFSSVSSAFNIHSTLGIFPVKIFLELHLSPRPGLIMNT